MHRFKLAIALLCLGVAAGCSKATVDSPVDSSDPEIQLFVQSELASKWPTATLADFQLHETTSIGGVEKREFSARIESADPRDPIAVKGFVSCDKASGAHQYQYDFMFGN